TRAIGAPLAVRMRAGIAGRRDEILPPDSAFELRKQEEVQHPKRVWTDEENADIGLSGLMAEYRTYLTGRARPAARGTIDKYAKSMKSLVASIARAGERPVLGSLTPAAVSRWISEQRSHVDEVTG